MSSSLRMMGENQSIHSSIQERYCDSVLPSPVKVDLSVVIPVYNESEGLEELFLELREILDAHESINDWEVVIIDDGSTDGSRVILESLMETYPVIRLIEHEQNRGQSAALRSGFSQCNGARIISIDGDLQYDLDDIPLLLSRLDSPESGSLDVVCGRREKRQDSLSKVILSRLAYVVRRILLGDKIHDAGCTFRAYGPASTKWLKSYEIVDGHHRFLPYILRKHGFVLGEVPVRHRSRKYNSSRYGNLRRIRKASVDILRIRSKVHTDP